MGPWSAELSRGPGLCPEPAGGQVAHSGGCWKEGGWHSLASDHLECVSLLLPCWAGLLALGAGVICLPPQRHPSRNGTSILAPDWATAQGVVGWADSHQGAFAGWINKCRDSACTRGVDGEGFSIYSPRVGASLVAQLVKNLPALQETWVRFLGQEDPLEKEMATHSSILTWRTPWTEEPGRLQSMGSQESDTT